MKITRRRLRRIIREAMGGPTLQQWADQHDLIVDRDPLTGQSVVLIDDVEIVAIQELCLGLTGLVAAAVE